MTNALPRSILFAVLALVAMLALTLLWIVGDMVINTHGQVTLGLINRALAFWVIAGIIVVFAAAYRAAWRPVSVSPVKVGLMVGAIVCAIELGVQLATDPSSSPGLLAVSLVSKLAAGLAGGLLAGRRIGGAAPDPQ